MSRAAALCAVAAAVLAGAPGAHAACPSPHVGAGYSARVHRALASGRDLWGEALLRSPAGPTYDGVRRYLKPLLLAGAAGHRPLTRSGVHYLAFGDRGSPPVALHVADGGQVLARRAGGPSLNVSAGGERFGTCLARLATPRLAGGYLPILQTAYRDRRGASYRQESFVARLPTGAVASFLRVTGAGVRLAAGGSSVGGRGAVYAAWPGRGRPLVVGRAAYEQARRSVVDYWAGRLAEGAAFEIPERRVADAERALLIQDLQLAWRYSSGNAYEELELPEALDAAGVLGEYGFLSAERSIVATALHRPLKLYPNLEIGAKLAATGLYFGRSRDTAFIGRETPVLRGYVAAIGRQLAVSRTGLLRRERYASDLPDTVYGLNDQAVVWQGLRSMAVAWDATGRPELARTSRALAAKLGAGLRAAVRRSERRLADGSLFLPMKLLGGERPYVALTASRPGSYWNLVAPYALASGLFPPGGREASGALRYVLLHGSRLLGLVRAGAFSLYPRSSLTASGTDQVYGVNMARFLADNHQAGQLVLSLYGQLAAGMTEGTFVAGEAATVAPVRGEYYRRMYLPPNSVANAAFLEELRLTLIHELPHGLELAYATPRAWLRPGRRIAVREAPTRFGPVSFSVAAGRSSLRVSVDLPEAASVRLRLRVPRGRLVATTLGRLDSRTGTVDLSGLSGSHELVVSVRARSDR